MSSYPSYGGVQSLPCQRCHAPLPPNEATCRNCGYYNAPAQGNNPAVQAPSYGNGGWNGAAPQSPSGQNQGQYGNSAWGQFSVPPTAAPTNPSPQAPNAFNNPPSMASVQPGGRNFFGAPVAPAPPTESNGYPSNQSAPPSFAPQRPGGAFSTDPLGPQSFVPPPMGPVSSAAYGAPSTGPASYGGPAMGPASQAPYGTPPAGFQQYGAPTSSGQLYPGMGQGPFDASRAQAGNPQSFPMGMAAPSSAPDLPDYAQPAMQEKMLARRGPKPWMIALIVLFVIVLIGGGGFFGYTLLKKQGSTTATPTTVTTGAVKGAVLFSDTFQNNTNGWSLQSDPGKFSISLAGGSLVIEDDSNELLWEPLPGNKTYGDFTLSVDAMLSQGDPTNGYGFYIRGASVQNAEMATYYRFELYGDGSYAIFKGTVDTNGTPTSAKLVNYTLNSAIQKQGIINHVSITAKGSTLVLTVNGQVVKTLTDASYTNGSIAPFVSNMQNAKPGAQAKFSNLTINAG
jgi:Domain of Unknown Function (DUF1080)